MSDIKLGLYADKYDSSCKRGQVEVIEISHKARVLRYRPQDDVSAYTCDVDWFLERYHKIEMVEMPSEKGRKDDSAKPKHSHYHKDVSQYDTIDIYVICDLYVKDNSGCIQHAVKKLLCCGNRGVKNNVKDLQEAIDTIQRKIEMLQGQGEAADD